MVQGAMLAERLLTEIGVISAKSRVHFLSSTGIRCRHRLKFYVAAADFARMWPLICCWMRLRPDVIANFSIGKTDLTPVSPSDQLAGPPDHQPFASHLSRTTRVTFLWHQKALSLAPHTDT